MSRTQGFVSELSKEYIDYFMNPRGVGEIEKADAQAEVKVQGDGCFDSVKLTLRIDGGVIGEAKFKARACSGTIAACSALVERLGGISLNDAAAVTADDIDDWLGGVPARKQHSVELAVRAIDEALSNYRKK